jgi:hypothetical protein
LTWAAKSSWDEEGSRKLRTRRLRYSNGKEIFRREKRILEDEIERAILDERND